MLKTATLEESTNTLFSSVKLFLTTSVYSFIVFLIFYLSAFSYWAFNRFLDGFIDIAIKPDVTSLVDKVLAKQNKNIEYWLKYVTNQMIDTGRRCYTEKINCGSESFELWYGVIESFQNLSTDGYVYRGYLNLSITPCRMFFEINDVNGRFNCSSFYNN